MTSVSTHVLDTARGRPATGVPVALSVWAPGGWRLAGESATGADGRVTDLPAIEPAGPTSCQLLFAVGEYLAATHGPTAFFPEITAAFMARPYEHYHLPLLLSPYGYCVYRGS
jgi:hydroxyisourate hydrolase